MRVWDAQTGTERLSCGGHGNWWEGWAVASLAWSPDGSRIASTATPIKEVRIWEVASGKNLYVYHRHANWVYAAAGRLMGRESLLEEVVQKLAYRVIQPYRCGMQPMETGPLSVVDTLV